MPSADAAIPTANNPTMGKRNSFPSATESTGGTGQVRCLGTKTSETSMSLLPVARRPAVSQVSMIRQSDPFIQVTTISGPFGPADIVSPLKTMHAGASQ